MPLINGDLRSATEQYQRQLISAALERHQDNWASAARELGLDRANLGRMAKRLGMK
jgi:anaerobic nitric oxide reductase transcription regulator